MNSNLKFKEELNTLYGESAYPSFAPTVVNNNILRHKLATSEVSEFSELTSSIKTSSRSLAALWILIAFQILDGIFTYSGIGKFGSEIEGNPIVSNLINSLGEIAALSLTKIFCILAILMLWSLRKKVLWVGKSLEFICAYYLLFAIIPWTVILAQN